MNRSFLLFLVAFCINALWGGSMAETPESLRGPVVDTYHGVDVPDPYRWLEDLDSPETKAWVRSQNERSSEHLGTLPGRDAFKTRLTDLLNYDSQGVYMHRGGWYYFYRRFGGQDFSVFCRRASLEGGADAVEELIDPNTLSEDKTTSLAFTRVSKNSRYLAYGLSDAGSDWRTVYVRNLKTGKKEPDVLKWVKFSAVSWTADEKGFYYSRFPEPETSGTENEEVFAKLAGQQIYYHRLGTDQSADILIHERPDKPKLGMGAQVTEDGRWLILYEYEGTNPHNALLVSDLGDPERPNIAAPTLRWDGEFESDDDVMGVVDGRLLVRTDRDAPNYRLVTVDPNAPVVSEWRELVPESEHVLRDVEMAKDTILAQYLEHVKSRVVRFDHQGTSLGDLPLPGIGTVGGLSAHPDSAEVFYSFSSFTVPSEVWRVDLSTGQKTLQFRPNVGVDVEAYTSDQVFFPSKDGTKIPMFLVYKKGTKKDGNNAVILSGYGGFNISLLPRFGSSRIPWLERGGMFALPNLRGGGEYGRDWHEAGMLGRKQNVFDDFQAAAEWLVQEGWSKAEHIGIRGGSNGGLLVGACLNQRPDLFGAAVPAVGVMDMLRFHTFTIGHAWIPEYGCSENGKDQFDWLMAYSPLHNVKPGTAYPAVLVTTGDHDDRVHPAHSYKYTAELQHGQSGEKPVLIRIEVDSGHGAGLAITKFVEREADVLAFLAKHLGLGR